MSPETFDKIKFRTVCRKGVDTEALLDVRTRQILGYAVSFVNGGIICHQENFEVTTPGALIQLCE